MQLLPSTAEYVNKARVSRTRLYQPKTNIRLGTSYLQYLKKKNKGKKQVSTSQNKGKSKQTQATKRQKTS